MMLVQIQHEDKNTPTIFLITFLWGYHGLDGKGVVGNHAGIYALK